MFGKHCVVESQMSQIFILCLPMQASSLSCGGEPSSRRKRCVLNQRAQSVVSLDFDARRGGRDIDVYPVVRPEKVIVEQ